MLAYLFRYDVIKRLSHGCCPIGPMGNAMRAVPSHPIPSHGTFPMGIPFPWTRLACSHLTWCPTRYIVPSMYGLGKESSLEPSQLTLRRFSAGMWKRLFFKRFRFHTYRFRFRFRRFRFHQQKTKKRPLTIFLNFCGSVACLLLHFIILRKQKPSFTAITLPTSLEYIVSNYSVFVFLRYQNSC